MLSGTQDPLCGPYSAATRRPLGNHGLGFLSNSVEGMHRSGLQNELG